MSRNRDIITNLNMDFCRHDATRFCKVIGKLGTLQWNAIDGTIKLFKKDAKQWKTIYKNEVHRDSTYISEWKHFINCIKNNKKPKSINSAWCRSNNTKKRNLTKDK